MFTGIVAAVGELVQRQRQGQDERLVIKVNGLSMTDVALGDSIAVNGVCLTAVSFDETQFSADVSGESLALTTLGALPLGAKLNLEKALTPSSRLGGHLVSGHVDGLGEVISRWPDGRSERFRLRAPAALARYIAHKGSITIDGTSLTVNQVDGAEFELNIVPHTLEQTIMAGYTAGTRVNLEVDLIARYLERLLLGEQAAQPQAQGVSQQFLAEHGFIQS